MGKALAAWLLLSAAAASTTTPPREVVETAVGQVIAVLEQGQRGRGQAEPVSRATGQRARVEIRRGPQVAPLPAFGPMPADLTGRVLLKGRDDLGSAHVLPADPEPGEPRPGLLLVLDGRRGEDGRLRPPAAGAPAASEASRP